MPLSHPDAAETRHSQSIISDYRASPQKSGVSGRGLGIWQRAQTHHSVGSYGLHKKWLRAVRTSMSPSLIFLRTERSSKKRGGPTSRVSTREPFESGDLEALLAVLVQLKTFDELRAT